MAWCRADGTVATGPKVGVLYVTENHERVEADVGRPR